jgi:uncharacterized cupin superfamily protein
MPSLSDTAVTLAQALIRNLDNVHLTHEQRDPLYEGQSARLAQGTAARKLGMSIDIVPPGKRACPYHFHYAQEEAFVVLEGSGTLRVADEMLPIRTGDVIFIPPGPEYPHQIINTSDAALKYLSISTMDSPEVVEYPDSGKYQALASSSGVRTLKAIQRPGASLDYWEDEP